MYQISLIEADAIMMIDVAAAIYENCTVPPLKMQYSRLPNATLLYDRTPCPIGYSYTVHIRVNCVEGCNLSPWTL